MAEGLLIQVGADFGPAEKAFAELIQTTGDFDEALVQLAKKGGVSINFLEKEIKDFKQAFSNATDPAEAKKFGDALQILKLRQQELINSSLSVAKAHGSQTVATQRLSSSLLGLSKIFDVLPPELAHITHGFDQMLQSLERAGEGGNKASGSFKNMIGVLGQVGLGLIISAGIGALINQITKLAEEAKKLSFSARDIREFNNAFAEGASKGIAGLELLRAKINDTNTTQSQRLELVKQYNKEADAGNKIDLSQIGNLDAINARIQAQIELLKKRAAVRAAEGIIAQKFEGLFKLQLELDTSFPDLDKTRGIILSKARTLVDAANKALNIKPQFDIKELVSLANLPTAELDKLSKSAEKFSALSDKKLVTSLRALGEQLKSTTALTKNFGQAGILEGLQNQIGEAQDGVEKALNTFGKILDFQGFTSEDKATKKIKEAFEQIRAAFVQGSKDLVNLVELNPSKLSLPFQIALDENKLTTQFSALNEQLRAKLHEFELRASSIPITIRQQINVDPNIKLPPEIRNDLEDKIRSAFPTGTPLKFEVDAEGKVHAKVDGAALTRELNQQINDAIVNIKLAAFTTLGDAIGEALTGGDISEAFKSFGKLLSENLRQIGVALIKYGIAKKLAINAIGSINPFLAIAAGVALIALSQALTNSLTNGAREKGGPVQQGFSYLVNERGREMFIPNNGGKPRMIEGGMQTFSPEVSGKILPVSLAKAVADRFKMPRFENGGLITGPVFGLLGEGAGISRFNPEVIAPLSTLKGLLGLNRNSNINLNLAMQTRGKDLKLIGNRTDRSQRRTT